MYTTGIYGNGDDGAGGYDVMMMVMIVIMMISLSQALVI